MNKKGLLALGLTGVMLTSMSATAFAATGLDTNTGAQPARTYTVGDTQTPDGSVDVDIEGMILDSWASVDPSNTGTNPVDTTDPTNPTKSSEYGGDQTYGNAYLTITAPTKIRFEAVGGTGATLVAGTGNVTNQSYYQPDPAVEGSALPRTKQVTMTVNAANINAGTDQFSINKNGITGTYVGDISNLGLKVEGAADGNGTAAYQDGEIGTYKLNAGGVAADQKTVTPSTAKITFAALDASGVNNSFADGYQSGSPLNASSQLNLTFEYIN